MTGARTSDYDFDLPGDQIAQQPLDRRDASRLDGRRSRSGDDHAPSVRRHRRAHRAARRARRQPDARASRASARHASLGRARGDLCCSSRSATASTKRWCRRAESSSPVGASTIAPGFAAEILEVTERRTRIVRLESDIPLDDAIERYGHVPLPPYIERPDAPSDAERYQTVFAREPGSVAAPTAGLHFTPELLAALAARGVARAEVLLHVGAGTFKPVEVEDPAEHVMHEEWYSVSPRDRETINDRRAAGGRVWAVGTTSVRTLESAADDDGRIRAGEGDTRIFIRPPYRFRAVDRIVTNFHLPRSTLIMLVAAFAGYDLTMRAYRDSGRRRLSVLFLRRRDGDRLTRHHALKST